MNEKSLEVCILAAGFGKRMRSNIPKVMQSLAGRPLLGHLINSVEKLNPDKIHVVVGPEIDAVRQSFPSQNINWVTQTARLGTGHAVMQVMPYLGKDVRLLILLGDAPLITANTMQELVNSDAPLTVLTSTIDNPHGYGRILRDHGESISAIVEQRDATQQQLLIKEINTGVMATNSKNLSEWLPKLSRTNAQGEFLLTDIVAIANEQAMVVSPFVTEDKLEVSGVNTFMQLADLERSLQQRYAKDLQEAGVHLVDPKRFDQRGELVCGSDVYIDANNIFEGHVTLGDGVRVGANCHIIDSVIEDGTIIKDYSHLQGCHVGPNSQLGPYARLRPGTFLENEVTIGNFVEVKNTMIGKNTKASHLTYLGDAKIGEAVNIGAGTITCNYDGLKKYQTLIEDNVFVGSNTAFVAPIVIGEGSTIGAGSTITKDVDSNVLGLSRAKQRTISDWKRPEDQD